MWGARFHLPDDIEVEVRPRRDGPPRRMARLSARDARTWHALAGRTAPTLERRLRPEVVANRAARTGNGWRPESLGASLRRLRGMMEPVTGAAARGAVFAHHRRPGLLPLGHA